MYASQADATIGFFLDLPPICVGVETSKIIVEEGES